MIDINKPSPPLQLIAELADDKDAAIRRFDLGVQTVYALGVPIADIALAGRLSTSRVSALLERAPAPGRVLGLEEIEFLNEHDFTVGLIPAAQYALGDYEDLNAYICQPNRTFRPEMESLGFYANAEIKPYFPKVRKTWPAVPFTSDEAARLRATGDPLDTELADIIDSVIAAPIRPGRKAGNSYKVILLTPREHPDTLKIGQPIKHLERGRGQAFVRKQRYTTRAALLREPKTTAELLRFERT